MVVLLYIIKNKFLLLLILLASCMLAIVMMAVNYSIAALLLTFLLLLVLFIYRQAVKKEAQEFIHAISHFDPNTSLANVSLPKSIWLSGLYDKISPVFLQLFHQKEAFDATLNAINDAIIRTDENGRILYINTACLNLFEHEMDELLHQPYASIKASIIQDEPTEGFEEIFAKIKSGKLLEQVFKTSYRVKVTRRTLNIEQHVKGVYDASGKFEGSVIVLRDVTQAEQMRARLRYQANYDSVTKLFNRYKFEQKLADAWHDAQDNKEQHALLQLDMDRFKLVNDNAGHAAGDQLLRDVGQLIKSVVRQSDICGRIGGDEFAVLLLGVSQESLLAIMQKLNRAFKHLPFSYNGQVFETGASIGATLINHMSPPLVEVKRQADAACFMAKNKGINCYQLFDYNDEHIISHQQEPRWAARINQALENDEFSLYFQTIKSLGQSQDSKQHLEILLRLESEGQILSPKVFLPAVERFRLSARVDHWVVSQAFDWLSAQPQYWQDIVISINLSADSLTNAQFIDDVLTCYQGYQFPAAAVCFEITETAAIANMTIAMQMVAKLRSVGFTISLDDFGKGFSTFSYLKNLPAQYIKIDGSYVKNILEDKCDFAIVSSINTLAKSLNMMTIAEYVQCDEAQKMLLDVGVDFVQGYGIAKPQPLASFQPS